MAQPLTEALTRSSVLADFSGERFKRVVPTFSAELNGVRLRLETSPSLFSPSRIDGGTRAMLRHANIDKHDKVLDLGCGYGVVGLYAAHFADPTNVCLVDIDPIAVHYARHNLESNGILGATVILSDGVAMLNEIGFTKILLNPPYHVDFSVPKRLIEKSFNRLGMGGVMILVCKREDWYRNKLRSIFGNVHSVTDASYYILRATKRSLSYANR